MTNQINIVLYITIIISRYITLFSSTFKENVAEQEKNQLKFENRYRLTNLYVLLRFRKCQYTNKREFTRIFKYTFIVGGDFNLKQVWYFAALTVHFMSIGW